MDNEDIKTIRLISKVSMIETKTEIHEQEIIKLKKAIEPISFILKGILFLCSVLFGIAIAKIITERLWG